MGLIEFRDLSMWSKFSLAKISRQKVDKQLTANLQSKTL